MTPGVRIAMWSGPRNISTAMMRSWEARGDTHVCDEPLYAHYLQQTGFTHPGADEVIAHHETDWRKVVDCLTGPIPGGRTIFYQKHMAHHLLEHMELDWVDELVNCFLIRDPREMLPSLAKVLEQPTVEQTGLQQQMALFDRVVSRVRGIPVVLDARDVLSDPAGVLCKCCDRIGVTYTDRMLSWTPGRRSTDGIWAKHWYAAVERSTGFERFEARHEPLPHHLVHVWEKCQPLYERLHVHRIRP